MTVHTGEIVAFDSLLHRSNLKPAEKSYIRKWADRMTDGKVSDVLDKINPGFGMTHVSAGLDTLRQGGEGITVGMLFGALSAHDMLEPFGIPLDGAGGALLTLLGVAAAGHESSKDARNVGIAGMTIYSYRKTEELLKTMGRGSRVAGEDETADADPIDVDGSTVEGEDPIVAFARTIP